MNESETCQQIMEQLRRTEQNRTVISYSEPRTNKYDIIMIIKEIYADE